MANWVDLPWDLLERISNSCIIHDHIRMQYVCKSWSSILKSTSRELPWLMMLPNNKEEEDPDARDFFSLSKQKIHTVHLPELRGKRCCGSFQNGWLMMVDDELDTFLFHPFLKRRLDLPHHSTLKRKNYSGSSAEEIRDLDILKAAVSDDCKVVVIVYGLGFLSFCRVGDDAYTEIDKSAGIDDVIFHKGKFYLLTEIASVYLLHLDLEEKEDGSPPHIEKLTVNLEADFRLPYTIFGYLVPDILTDSMFVIARDVDGDGDDDDANQEEDNLPHKTTRLDVYSVILEDGSHDKTLRRFTKVESLGDRVLFLGHNSPIVVLASQFPGLKGNCIYFADNMAERYCNSPHGCCDSGVFSLEDGTVEVLFADRFHPIMSPPLWIATPPYSSLLRFLRREAILPITRPTSFDGPI